jgi:predicted CxxxxCH...CXXCH cytochrome family protein
VSYYDLGGQNICLRCHSASAPRSVYLGIGVTVEPKGRFETVDASNAIGSNASAVDPTSHMWAGMTAGKSAAGASEPSTYLTEFNGRYGVSRNRVTCSRCHDPHGVNDVDSRLLKVSMDSDQLCKACHSGWNQSNEPIDQNGWLTHPMVADYATVAAAKNADASLAGLPAMYNDQITNIGKGNVRLVSGGVSCTSCHGMHFADSDATTDDGLYQQAHFGPSGSNDPLYTTGLAPGDGHQLRTDGPSGADKSALCQACHAYKVHGDNGTRGTAATVGCLVCHSGHSHNAGAAQYYVLRKAIGAPYNVVFGSPPYDYSAKPASYNVKEPWQDGATGSANGWCEKCHGDADAIPGTQHTNSANCLACHMHNGVDYSFQSSANAHICGDCHGFPPYRNIQGDRFNNPDNEGGYAYISAANNYTLAPDYNNKNEALTPHNAHAAGGLILESTGLPQGIDSDYRMGDGEVACSTCHGIRPSHDTGSATVLGSYQDIQFDDRAIVTGQTAPNYSATGRETCTNVYCHSNGGRRTGDSPTEATRAWTFVETPYVGNPTNSGWKNAKGSLIAALPDMGSSTECSTCHGNSAATMTTKGNSLIHNKHLNANFTCKVCHLYTATDNITVPKVARDISKNAGDPTKGTHVNYKVDVKFDPGYTAPIGSGTYAPAPGTCTVYCHSNGGSTFAPLTYTAPDWDATPATTQCNFCHGNAPTSGSHTRHVGDANGPTLACAECHVNAGSYTTAGGHADHINGTVNIDYGKCNVCHAVDAGETAPQWGQPATRDCKTCHIGTLDSNVEGRIAPKKSAALTTGHGLTSGGYGAPTNKSAANKDCTVCHNTSQAGHFNGSAGNKLLSASGSDCRSCHDGSSATAVLTHSNQQNGFGSHSLKNPGIAAFTKVCTACHDPHGTSNKAMIINLQADQNARDPDGSDPAKQYRGNVVFSAFSGADSFDEADSGANADDICATCHTVTDHNRYNADVATHSQGSSCLTCHGHNGANGGFMPTGGNACDSCHGNPPASTAQMPHGGNPGAHAAHTRVSTPYLGEDLSDCALCHPNAASYTYSGGHADHINGSTNLAAGISNSTCSAACHASSAGDGNWSDANGLNCTACHGNPPAGNNHGKHVAAGMACSGCHGSMEATGSKYPFLVHKQSKDTSTDALKIQTQGKDYLNPSGTAVNVTVTTWVNSAVTNDSGNTCANVNCHNPSNTTYKADWDVDTASCSLCHGAGTGMNTGRHDMHVNNAAVIGDNIACTACHPDNTLTGGNAHTLNAGNTQGVVQVGGSKANTYNGELALPNTAYGACTASQCHNNGKGSNVTSPSWGRTAQSGDNCTICHAAPPSTADHGGHWIAGRQSLGLGCRSCHNNTAASDTTIKAGSLHLNGSSYNVAAGGTYNAVAVTIGYTQATPSTCTANCHAAPSTPYNWASVNTCEGCHSGKVAEAKHAKHVIVSPDIDSDKSDCAKCHPGADTYTTAQAGNHRNGSVNLGAGISSGASGCTAACHLSGASDGYWSDPNGLDCAACHFYNAAPTGALNSGHARPLSTSHNKHFNKGKVCTDCHGTLPTDTSHITDFSGADEGAKFDGKAHALQDEANVTRASVTFNDTNNTCSGAGIGLGCHASGTPDWDVPITACTTCHTNETDATFNPTSGLHNAATATRHDDTLQSGACVNCHSSASPSSLHQNGTKNSASTATFTWNANVTAYSAANGCNATCHTDGGDWRRKWSGAVDAKPLNTNNPGDAVCANCHGDPTNGWRWNEANATTVDHTDANGDLTDNVTGSHGTCQSCHGWGAAGYNKTWRGASDAAWVGHGDQHITMNGPKDVAGSGYDNATGGCAQSCHLDVAGRRMNTNSGWASINYGDFGSGSCNSCHGYPPAVGDGKAYQAAEGKGAHVKHVNHLAARAGVTLNASTDTFGNANTTAVCGACHDMAAINHEISGGNRAISVPSGYQFGASGPQYNGIEGNPSTTTPKNCSSVSCHFKTTPVWE